MNDDLELERRALLACGYRVHEKSKNGAHWLMAVKGLDVQYKHWHPLTNINQAMQLLIEAPQELLVRLGRRQVECEVWDQDTFHAVTVNTDNAQDVIDAQCRAIVTACASLEPVR